MPKNEDDNTATKKICTNRNVNFRLELIDRINESNDLLGKDIMEEFLELKTRVVNSDKPPTKKDLFKRANFMKCMNYYNGVKSASKEIYLLLREDKDIK